MKQKWACFYIADTKSFCIYPVGYFYMAGQKTSKNFQKILEYANKHTNFVKIIYITYDGLNNIVISFKLKRENIL
jgi:hypothetical protein